MDWFRFYVETIHDTKVRRLPPAQRWVWVAVLTMASQSPKPGYLLLSDPDSNVSETLHETETNVSVTIDDLADLAKVEIKDVEEGISTFIRQKMLHVENGVYVVTNWNKRQYVSDSSTERVRKHRDKKRGNGSETLQVPDCKRSTEVTETPPDTEADTDTDTDLNTTTSTKGESPDSDQSDKPDKPYEVVEALMQQMMVKPNFILKTTDYHALKTLLDAKIPLDFIVEGIGFAFDQFKKRKKPGTINSFTYCAPIIQEAWELKNAEREVAAANRTGRNSQKQLVALGSQGSTSGGQKDDRYSAFYQLFPDS